MKLDEFLDKVSETLGTDPELIKAVRDDLLDLTKDVAHNAVRPGAPLSAFLVGLSLNAESTPEQVRERIALVKKLVSDEGE
ncbi:DUF6457 domain-containing protein [Corynebacterium sp. H130]|uniref:DUF6457 domain-containing protein n=1 Tax=Corynebacterium sp. H130 TaxID=3133444 RepID=UPI0030B7DC32